MTMAPFPAPVATYHHATYPALDPTRPELSAKGKTIVVTGGGTGIGAEIVKYFAKAGAAKILILGRRESPLISTQKFIQADYPNVEIFAAPTDITKKDQVDAAFAKFIGDTKVNVLVSNAGLMCAMKAIKDVHVDEWFEGITTNVKGSFNISQAFLRYASSNAVLINISSAWVHVNFSLDGSSYAVAKAAALRFFSSLAHEHPELTIYNIQPGLVFTDISEAGGFREDGQGMTEENKSYLAIFDKVSLPASFVVWLASPQARFLKGKFVWSNWDVEELSKRKEEIEKGTFLDFGLVGWPFKSVNGAETS